MTREVVERELVNKVKELLDIYREYNPEGHYLSIGILIKDNYIHINNEHWKEDIEAPVNVSAKIYDFALTNE